MASSALQQQLMPYNIESSDITGLEGKDIRGSGSYGAVYAVTVRGNARIAKRLHGILVCDDMSQNEKQCVREKFLNECLVLSKLDHPNIVKFVGVYFSPQDTSDVSLIMEQLHMDLEKFLNPNRNPTIDTLTKLSLLLDVSSGLLYLHSHLAQPIIHCDLKPENILLTLSKRAKIADLGVSKVIDRHLHRAVTHSLCPGTLAYMPPEALIDKPKYDTPLDVFSFGQLALYVTLQQLPTPFEISPEMSTEEAGRAFQLGEVAILKRKKWLDILPDDHCLRGLILTCLKDNPCERPSTETLNARMKMLCTLQELLQFKISSSDIEGLEDKDTWGSGSYSAVYAVTVRGTSRIAKCLHSILTSVDVNQSEKQGIRGRFLNECLLLSKLDHPNVVKFIGVHFNPHDTSDVSLIMEKLDKDLERFLSTNHVDTSTKLTILLDVSSGLLYLHTQLAQPIIHCDLKAENVLLTLSKRAKIADLGVSKLIDRHLYRAVIHSLCPGTLAYMPPEALIDKPKYDTPLDVFSFGQLALYVTLQQLPTPFEISPEMSTEEAGRAFQLGEVAILKRKKWLDILPDDHCLRGLILTCLKDNPSERPNTETLNARMKVLCTIQELLQFKISSSDFKGLEDEDSWGSGSYGAVHAITVRGTSRIAKRLHSILMNMSVDVDQSEKQRIRGRFLNECLLLSKLDHPNIVKFIGVHFNPHDTSDVSLIMEQLHMDLEKFLDPSIKLDIFTKLSILLDVSSGLLYLHTRLPKPIIHCDLKAENILLTQDFQAKIADLGVSKLIDKQTATFNPGTRAYMPPEALVLNPKYDTPLDVFSFGQLALYVALQQFPVPFEMSHVESSKAYRSQESAILKRKKWLDMLPKNHCLCDLILSCLRHNPSERPSTDTLNTRMKELCSIQELLPFKISSSDIKGLKDKDNRGSGSFGTIYAVTVKGTSRIAKRLHSILVGADVYQSEKQGIRERFLNECILLSKLDHPNIVKFIGVHFSPHDTSDVSLIMEQLHMDLKKYLNSNKNLDEFTKMSILLDVSSGLLYLHTQSPKPIIHRDLTAENILLTQDFMQAKIADLGASKLIDITSHRAVTFCPGARDYMPPEALVENPKYDTPLDVFSFGQMALYVALREFPAPFEMSHLESSEAYRSQASAIHKRKKWLDMLPKDHCLNDLILSCLRDVPRERPSTATLNAKMKVLCTPQELLPFKISSSDIKGLEDKDSQGSSSYGAVYAVTVRGTARIAKRLHSILMSNDVDLSEKRGIRERFLNECLILSKLDHPNVVKFVGVHFNPQDHSDVTLIMEQLHMDLEFFLESENDIDICTKLSILLDVSSGLLYLHTQSDQPIIHRDLSAGNVLLTKGFKRAKIADLGVSKLLYYDAQKHLKSPGALAYMAPESLIADHDKAEYGTPLDVFSFGHLALYTALQQFPYIALELSPEHSAAYQTGEVAILKRKKWLDMLPKDHTCNRLHDLILLCLKDVPSERPSTEILNVEMKMLCPPQELLPFKISSSDIKGLEDEEIQGSGSYGAVYAITVRGTSRIAKRLHSILVDADVSEPEKQRIRGRFLNECVLLSMQDHPNIVKFIGVHFNPHDISDVSLIMEQLHMDLEKFLDPNKNLETYTKLSILLDVSSGLLYLHNWSPKPIIHRDLKADNILLTKNLQAKIADLGVSKLIDEHLHRPMTKCPGAHAYMSPEALVENPK